MSEISLPWGGGTTGGTKVTARKTSGRTRGIRLIQNRWRLFTREGERDPKGNKVREKKGKVLRALLSLTRSHKDSRMQREILKSAKDQ